MSNPFETEERAAYRETVRKFVEAEIKPFADEWDEAGAIPWELHEKAGRLAITEPSGGADVAKLKTTVRRDLDGRQ